MKLLITGSNGQLGHELQKILKNNQSELGPVPEVLKNADVTAVDIDQLDISNIDIVQGFVTDKSPDIIINCAAYTNVNGCETEQNIAFKANAIGPRNLAIVADAIGAKLLHVSTDYVFDGEGKIPKKEWDLCSPQSVYGHTKHMGEQYISSFCDKYFIVRTAWLYGYVGSNFVKTILKAAKERGSLKIVSDQWGNPTNASDLAYHLLKIVTSQEYGIYHCTNNGECTWYDFACEFIRLAGFQCKISPCTTEEYPTPAKRPAYSSLDNMMLRCTVGDEMRSWQDAIASYMEHYDKITGDIKP